MIMPRTKESPLPKFVVRLPDNLRGEIEAAADAADTSMNTIFVRALRQFLDKQARQDLLLDALAHAAAQRNGDPGN
jgi:predicted transcriptional regulator